MHSTGWKLALGLAAVGGVVGLARARARRREDTAAPDVELDQRDTAPYPAPFYARDPNLPDNNLPEELRTILSPAFASAHRTRNP